ncbi:replication protein RepA [Nocardia sp. NPDC050408]|uniref:replication protein RepA n=1 Tax=Nocardia sp. NPDC050408 TaxID=3364319 RepID=UPI003798620A
MSSRELELANAAAELWASPEQEIGYLARLFSQTSLPYQNPGDLPVWYRRNGALTLTVQPGVHIDAHGNAKSLGYPYGTVPRLLLTWLSTEAVRTKSPELLLGESLSDFMRKLDLTPTGGKTGTITRLRGQMERLFQANLSVRIDDGDPDHQAGAKLSVASSYDLWWAKGDQPALLPSTVRLTGEFFDEVTTRPVPVDLGALRALRRSPMRLDIYAWLTHRMSYLQRQTVIPWEALRFQFGSTLKDTKQGRLQFKRDFERHLKEVLVVYRDARVEVSPAGVILRPSFTHVPYKGIRAFQRNANALENT